MSAAIPATPPKSHNNGGQAPFSLEGFAAMFDEVRPLILAEWPTVDAKLLEDTNADLEAIISLVAAKTSHSKTLVRQHLTEIAEVAGVEATGVEARLVRLLHMLESKVEPLQEGGKWAIDEVRQSVPRAKKKMRENIWTTMLASVGVGLMMGLIVGLSRGR